MDSTSYQIGFYSLTPKSGHILIESIPLEASSKVAVAGDGDKVAGVIRAMSDPYPGFDVGDKVLFDKDKCHFFSFEKVDYYFAPEDAIFSKITHVKDS